MNLETLDWSKFHNNLKLTLTSSNTFQIALENVSVKKRYPGSLRNEPGLLFKQVH